MWGNELDVGLFSVWIGVDACLCGGSNLTLCGPKLTCFCCGDRVTRFLCGLSTFPWFLDAGRQSLGFSVSIEIDLISVWRSNLTRFQCRDPNWFGICVGVGNYLALVLRSILNYFLCFDIRPQIEMESSQIRQLCSTSSRRPLCQC